MMVYSRIFGIIGFTVLFWLLLSTSQVFAKSIDYQNNKFGIHLSDGTSEEVNIASKLLNSTGGDWGYIAVVMRANDKSKKKWQDFFNEARRKHLIPIIRLATRPEGEIWTKPKEDDAKSWADFLDSLNWPIKNRYVVVYNEPNHAKEWGGQIDAASYAKELKKTYEALKTKNDDFLILNAGFDQATPHNPPNFEDEFTFLSKMEEAEPGIFELLDGWVSHSYPNPGFSASPGNSGLGSIRGYLTELNFLQNRFGVSDLPVFITETGWARNQADTIDLTDEDIATYFKTAYSTVWGDKRVFAVTPFLLFWEGEPFEKFSWLKVSPQAKKKINSEDTYAQFKTVQSTEKQKGEPLQEIKGVLVKSNIPRFMVRGESYHVNLKFRNTGQSIWGENNPYQLVFLNEENEFSVINLKPSQKLIEPENFESFQFDIKAPQKAGDYILYFDLKSLEETTIISNLETLVTVTNPTIIQIQTNLKFRRNNTSEVNLLVFDDEQKFLSKKISLDKMGRSYPIEFREVIPSKKYQFVLEKRGYTKSVIEDSLEPGLNKKKFPELIPGDLNFDGKISFSDILKIPFKLKFMHSFIF